MMNFGGAIPRLGRRVIMFVGVAIAAGGASLVGDAYAARIHVNQQGFLPESGKIAIVPNVVSGEFWLVDAKTGSEVLRGPLSQAQAWDVAGETVKVADFTAFNKPGHYKIRVSEAGESPPFSIREKVYDPVLAAAVKSFYYN